MLSKRVFMVVSSVASSATALLVACSSSSSGGVAAADAASDAPIDVTVDVTDAADEADVDAGACAMYPTDGDAFTACLVAMCCFDLLQCGKDCIDYKACVLTCTQMDADSSCYATCGTMHSNGAVELHNLDDCGRNKCSTPVGDH
jgi:hypothetical protein